MRDTVAFRQGSFDRKLTTDPPTPEYRQIGWHCIYHEQAGRRCHNPLDCDLVPIWALSVSAAHNHIALAMEPETVAEDSYVNAISPPDDFSDTWDLIVDLRQDDWDEANYEARDELYEQWPSIDFDPESSCFYAYAHSKEDAEEFARALDVWVARRGGR